MFVVSELNVDKTTVKPNDVVNISGILISDQSLPAGKVYVAVNLVINTRTRLADYTGSWIDGAQAVKFSISASIPNVYNATTNAYIEVVAEYSGISAGSLLTYTARQMVPVTYDATPLQPPKLTQQQINQLPNLVGVNQTQPIIQQQPQYQQPTTTTTIPTSIATQLTDIMQILPLVLIVSVMGSLFRKD